MKTIHLRPGKERALLRGHPWIYDNALASGGGDSGETVRVVSSEGKFLAWAAFSPSSKIRARVWSFDEAQRIDAPFFVALCAASISARSRLGYEKPIQSDGVRLIHGEVDGLPGLIVDQYGDTLVAQFLSAGVERQKKLITAALLQASGLKKLYERSDASSRTLEGLPAMTGWLAGGEGAPEEVVIQEHAWKLQVSISEGHKTGFYLDQRDNRHRFAQEAARLKFRRMLNCYCYTGGFTAAGLTGLRDAGALEGAQITSIDSSGPAIERAKANLVLNGFEAQLADGSASFMDADVNASLRQFIAEGRTFDMIILDPPKFAPSAAHAERAARAYKDINRLAFKLLEPGGLLYTFSCSGGIDADLFHKIVAGAAMDAGVDGYITAHLNAAPDHPITMRFPEGEYLKGLVVMKK
ncbi:class I SAM-dependent rRNA methyltransferase [Variovorax sp. PCZ-1]|uniref:class I SAM-dependent rRNA methyltransferase n=1 Tax=Variovorax sp. PCZ-1 TaxID=2835533 RepID=UPI001BCE62BF|nr:class I SAM-dependent rRNA methyltransferase [Variovorax sp. PCZ-1]MBS7806249.1 class I SAM-dependent rRNA methyltransferase [Variovorax sp. PCZ-1]